MDGLVVRIRGEKEIRREERKGGKEGREFVGQ